MHENVLIIDDEPDVLEAFVDFLEAENISCISESDPVQAIATFRTNPTDIVVADFWYDARPDFSGLNLIDEIRKIKPSTKTILMSGRIDHEALNEQELAIELQAKFLCDYYLSKPVGRQLIEIIKTILRDVEEKSSNWKAIAEEYTKNGQVASEDVRQTNEAIKHHLIAAVDKESE